MSYPTVPFLGSLIGESVFENDGALVPVAYIDELTDLEKLTPATTANGGKVVYSLYAAHCSSDEAGELVRRRLDSGVLHKVTARIISNYLSPLKTRDNTCDGFVPVILGACAMSHCCRTRAALSHSANACSTRRWQQHVKMMPHLTRLRLVLAPLSLKTID
jgi:hypothetical protein